MKPRIFISSTFYDLKYIREDLANFVRSYGYEPILFEDGDIGYTPGKELDMSCYESMKNSEMVILIIGGEYGSAASGEKKDGFKEYISVTRNEFRTAIESGIPVFVMIDKKVMVEYGVYEANYDSIEKEDLKIKFATVKNINVFRFIKEVKGLVVIPIQEFEKSSEIKAFISKQWADMFKNYLVQLRGKGEDKRIESSVNEMKNLILKMNVMLDSVGKNVLSKDDSSKYDEVINEQEVLSFCNHLVSELQVCIRKTIRTEDERKKIVVIVLNCVRDSLDLPTDEKDFIDRMFDELMDYKVSTITFKHISKISAEKSILYNRENLTKIINVLSSEEYFYKFVV